MSYTNGSFVYEMNGSSAALPLFGVLTPLSTQLTAIARISISKIKPIFRSSNRTSYYSKSRKHSLLWAMAQKRSHARPSIKRLREVFSYDPETGIVTRLKRARYGPGRLGPVGTDHGDGYLQVILDGQKIFLHRLAWALMTGEWIDEIDHRKPPRSNNRWSNLREATTAQNQWNSKGRSDSISGCKGVSWDRARNLWIVRIKTGGRSKFVGRFRRLDHAEQAYNRAAAQYHGDFAYKKE